MSIPEGWKLVPSTPTPEWVMAAAERGVHRGGSFALMIHDVLAASPVMATPARCATCCDQGEIPSGEMQYQGEWQPPEPIMIACPECEGDQDPLPAIPQPAAHLTIPGALEWDGDNGTHGADGESSECGESEVEQLRDENSELRRQHAEQSCVFCNNSGELLTEVKRLRALLECSQGDMRQADQIMARQRVELDSLEQSRRSFFDLSQDLEKRLAERDAALNQAYMALIGYLPGHRNDITDAAIAACSAILFPVEAEAACSRCGDWGHIETEDSAHDCPECGPSVVERAVEARVMNAPPAADDDRPAGCCCPPKGHTGIWAAAMCPVHHGLRRLGSQAVNREQFKQKTCIECDQPYCHGVCVQRGDEHYDRDQAQKGGEQ